MAKIVITFCNLRQHKPLDDDITVCDNLDVMSIGSRIKEARERHGWSQPELARKCGWESQSRISLYENDKREPAWSDLRKIAKALGEPVSFFLDEPGPKTIEGTPIISWSHPEDLPEGQFVFVPRYDVHVSAGNGQLVYETMEKEQPQAFRSDWIRKLSLSSKNLMVIYARGRSMEPVIFDGYALLVDRAQRQVVDGKIYVIRYGNDVKVKRLFKRFDGGLIIKSDNKDEFSDEIVSVNDLEHVEVIGRVVHVSGEI
jgi:phage repressor protein C with HTH and peptisase S24 domain